MDYDQHLQSGDVENASKRLDEALDKSPGLQKIGPGTYRDVRVDVQSDYYRPSIVTVGSLRYTILYDANKIQEVSDVAKKRHIEKDAEWTAFSDHDKLIIGINPNNPTDIQKKDIVHEILHCCLRMSGVWPNSYADLVGKAKGKDGGYTVEEFVIASMTGPLVLVFMENRELFDWIVS